MSTYKPIKKVKDEQSPTTVSTNEQERKPTIVTKTAIVSASKQIGGVRKPHRYRPSKTIFAQPLKRQYVAPPHSEHFIPHNIPLIDVPPDFSENQLPTKQCWNIYNIFRNQDYDLLCQATTKIAAMQWVQIYRNINPKHKIDVFIGNRSESPELFEGIVIEEHEMIDELTTEYVIK